MSNLTPYYEHAGITIYHGDCREILPQLPKVDLVLTDPPYGVSYVTARRLHADKLRHPIVNDESLDTLPWVSILDRLSDDRHWYVFASPRNLAAACDVFQGFKHILAWDKGDRGTVGDLECGFGEAWEAVFYGMKGRRPLNGKRPRTIIRHDWSGTLDPVHPTVKPVPLLERFVNWSTGTGETVLDPFGGSGTTLRAAKDLGRRAIGIEIEERYCEIAANRCQQEVLSFAQPGEVTKKTVDAHAEADRLAQMETCDVHKAIE